MCTRRNDNNLKKKKKKKKGESKGIRGMGSFIFVVEVERSFDHRFDDVSNRNYSSQSIVMPNRQIRVTFN